jgi:hypothetical protein
VKKSQQARETYILLSMVVVVAVIFFFESDFDTVMQLLSMTRTVCMLTVVPTDMLLMQALPSVAYQLAGPSRTYRQGQPGS